MTATRSRSVAALAAGALFLAALAGCGSDDAETRAASAPTGTAVDKTAFVTGLVDAVKEQSSARIEASLGTAITASGAFQYGEDPKADISASLMGQKLRLVMLDEALYLQKAAGQKFVKLSKDDPSLSMFGGGLEEMDPQKALTGIAEGIEKVTEVGPETIDGVELTRYTVALDSEAIGNGMLAMIPGFDATEELVVDLYVDAENLVHQATADLGDNDLSLTFSDWGQPVTVKAPPAAEILSNPTT